MLKFLIASLNAKEQKVRKAGRIFKVQGTKTTQGARADKCTQEGMLSKT